MRFATPEVPVLSDDVLDLLSAIRRSEGEVLRHLSVMHTRGDLVSEGWGGSMASWLIARAGMSRYRAHQWQQTATQLAFLPAMSEAVTSGAASIDHAAAVFRAAKRGQRERLTEKFDEAVPSEYVPGKPLWTLDEVFADIAAHEPVAEVNRAVKEFLNRVDGERRARQFIERQERRHVVLTPTLDGSWHLEGLLDDVAGAAVRTALDDLMCPNGIDDQRSAGQRRADALRQLAETTGPKERRSPTIVVTIDGRALTEDVTDLPHAGVYDRRLTRAWANVERDPVPVDTARRLACDAKVLGVVVGRSGRVLNLGRSRRLVSPAQRTALAIEQPSCMFPGCQVPWQQADAHHIVPWAEGGRTDMANLVHLCHRHHDAVHSGGWRIARMDRRTMEHHDPDAPPPAQESRDRPTGAAESREAPIRAQATENAEATASSPAGDDPPNAEEPSPVARGETDGPLRDDASPELASSTPLQRAAGIPLPRRSKSVRREERRAMRAAKAMDRPKFDHGKKSKSKRHAHPIKL